MLARAAFFTAMAIGLGSTPAGAQDGRLHNSVGAFLTAIAQATNPDLLDFFNGALVNIEEGLATANSLLKSSGQPQLYCTPTGFPVTADMLTALLRHRAEESGLFEFLSLAEGVFVAMANAFPCEEPAVPLPRLLGN